ncbi:MAG: phosphopantothenoylcysteine decarboxylase / phosphopantothenate---cysteine ligase [Bacteroidota bacterium]|nr:phosphopantothenoylcysteine decarboxylase / phosphopantothenate---cysteine ligase [Bacteroidota bacterium]
MGIAIADAAADLGADVELVLGPADVLPANRSVKIINVTTSQSMAEECISRFPGCDAAILSAAVADFTPERIGKAKIKKNDKGLILRLIPTTDIAAQLGKMKKPTQVLVGFALETDNEVKNATGKLKRKNLDFIVLNSLRDSGAGFGHDTNRITIIDKFNNIDKFELKSKQEAAGDILKKIVSLIK